MKRKKSMKTKSTTSKNLESRFENGKNVLDYFESETKRVGVDLPPWAIKALDQEAARRGITRQSLIKTWLVDHLDEIEKKKVS